MTRRERLERKLQLRKAWAETRAKRADTDLDKAMHQLDGIEPGQPILIGHHSERRHRAALERHDNAMHRSIESHKMAELHESKADGIAVQLESSVFSDDPDAIEQIQARIAEREAERDRIKAYNASCRKGTPDETLLDDAQRKNLEVVRRVCPYQLGPRGEYPSYSLSNLGANIRRDMQRVEQIKRRNARQEQAESAGGVLIRQNAAANWASITFAQKPDRDILNALRTAGFSWGGGSWSGYADKIPDCVRQLASEQA